MVALEKLYAKTDTLQGKVNEILQNRPILKYAAETRADENSRQKINNIEMKTLRTIKEHAKAYVNNTTICNRKIPKEIDR